MAQAAVTLKALGLKLSPNQLELPPGSMSEASNVIIRRDNVVQSRRGYKLYGSAFGLSSDVVKQILSYKDVIIRHYGTTLQFQTSSIDDDGVTQFNSFSGSYSEPEAGIRIKGVESNGNYYFTTSDGVKKISAKSSSEFSTSSGYITNAGGVKAIDFTTELVYENGNQSGSIGENQAVRYQIVWGIKDANDNLVLGTPSPSLVVGNNMRELLIQDFNTLLSAIDNAALSGGSLSSTSYASTYAVPISGSATLLRTNMAAVAGALQTDTGTAFVPLYSTIQTNILALTISTPATYNELVLLQAQLSALIERLKISPNAEIQNAPINYLAAFITPLDITTSSNVRLKINIPDNVTLNHFFQVYRSEPQIVDGVNSFDAEPPKPSSELRLAFEGFVSSTDLANEYVYAIDETPQSFLGAYLYTNSATGEGAANANEPPPVAKDVNRYKNVVFYANTKTFQRMNLNLLGVQQLANGDNITIATESSDQTYTFTTGVAEVRTVTTDSFANTVDDGYFTLYSGQNKFKRFFWFEKNATPGTAGFGVYGGTLPSGFTADEAVMVYIAAGTTTDAEVASRIGSALASFAEYWSVGVLGNVVTITNKQEGEATNTVIGGGLTGTWATSTTTAGAGGVGASVLLSSSPSPAVATETTALDLVRAINLLDPNVYAYYTSTVDDVPGKISLIARTLSTSSFYVLGNNSNVGISFDPDVSPQGTFTNTVANPTVVTTSSAHGLQTSDKIIITGSTSTPSLNGIYTVTVTGSTTFTLPVNVTVGGAGSWEKLTSTDAVSSNEQKINRVYYSKFQQPEAVPLLNYFDVGAADKAILRIFPLRDSLFVFKEDGLYRISGEASPFVLALFDVSCILLAPDSVSVANNLVYAYTRAGISVVSESGTSLVSRDIDTQILKIPALNFQTFRKATWGVGYESDNSYIVYTTKTAADTIANIGYRYSNLTDSWTTYDLSATCGLVNPADDKLYMGAGDTNYLLQERKSFDRTDFADRELIKNLTTGQLSSNIMKMASVSDVTAGDVIVQTQTLSVYTYNMLLKKLDLDSNIGVVAISSITTGATPTVTTSSSHTLTSGDYVRITGSNSTPSVDGTYVATVLNATQFTITPTNAVTVAGTSGYARYQYYENLYSVAGDNLRSKIESLCARLDNDPGTAYSSYLSDITATSPLTITAVSETNPATVTTSAAHGLITGRVVSITSSNSTPTIDGTKVVTVTGANTFTVNVGVTVAGTSGSAAVQTGDFRDLKVCYNKIISNLNADSGPAFNNYSPITDNNELEAVITSVNTNSKEVTLSVALPFVIGEYTVYKAIPTTFTYSNLTLGDPLNMKQIYESTLMFDTKTFTQATLSFSTDLLPEFQDINFTGQGNGIFGNNQFGGGFFGGLGHSAPFRTYVPRQCQRCRFLNVKYTHRVAREMPEVYGLTLTGNTGISTRAYR
jgi:hypothetical protein